MKLTFHELNLACEWFCFIFLLFSYMGAYRKKI